MTGLTRKAAIARLAATYGWDRNRVDRAILRLCDHFGRTSEVYYPDPANYRQVTVVEIRRVRKDSYEISEENRPARLAAEAGVRYSKRVPKSKAALKAEPSQEAIPLATATKRGRAKAKVVEPEPVEDEVEELEEELEEEDVEDEAEEAEDEDVEEDEEDEEDEEQDEDAEEEVEDEAAEDGEEEAKDYTVYAGKAITPTMQDFHDWLNQEVGDLSDMDTARIVALAGTLRMEFQRSDFCHERREGRKAQAAAAKAAPKPAKVAKEAPAKVAKEAPAKTAAKTKTAAPAKATAAKTATRAVPGKPAPRAADRPAPARKTTARRGKPAATQAPF